MFVRENRIDS